MTRSEGGEAGARGIVNGVGGWDSREVLDQHNVALRPAHLHVEYPPAVGRGGEARAAPERFLLDGGDPRRPPRGEAVHPPPAHATAPPRSPSRSRRMRRRGTRKPPARRPSSPARPRRLRPGPSTPAAPHFDPSPPRGAASRGHIKRETSIRAGPARAEPAAARTVSSPEATTRLFSSRTASEVACRPSCRGVTKSGNLELPAPPTRQTHRAAFC